MTSSANPIINVGIALEQALKKQKFSPKHFIIIYDHSVSLSSRADKALIRGDEKIFSDFGPRTNLVPFASFYLETVKCEISVHDFLNPIRKPRSHSRSGNRDEVVAFIELHSEEAQKGRVVCFNSCLFDDDEVAPLMIAFYPRDYEFEAVVLPFGQRSLLSGDMVIMRK